MKIRIRFNTDTIKTPEAGLPEWRVLIEDTEYQVKEVRIEAPCWTTRDLVGPDLWKWHITTEGIPEWEKEKNLLIIKPLK